MPFRSQSQRRLFYAKMNRGEFSPEMVKKWEEHTPKGKKLPDKVEKRAMEGYFWQGFKKRAVDNFVTATGTNDYPGAPEKMLKWNDHGGVDPRQPEELQAAQVAGLVTLPPDIPGALCGTCMHFRPITHEMGHGFCTNPEIKMDVTDRMHCIHWTHPGVHNPAEAAEQEAQEAQFQQAMAAQQGGVPAGSYNGQIPPDVEGQTTSPQDFSGQIPQDANTQSAGAGQDTTLRPQTSPEAETTEGDTGQEYQPSSVGSQSGFPQGRQTAANPLVEQAVQDFQGSGAVGGGTGVDNESPAPKKKSEGKKTPGGKGHTININVSGEKAEKTASVNFWKGIVDGY